MRLMGYLAWLAACVALYYIMADAIVRVAPVVEANHTARVVAQEAGATARWQATTGAVAAVAPWAALGAVLIVAAVQAGRSVRHWQTERTRRRALLALYMARCLPQGTSAQIVTWRGELAVADHDAGEIIPWQEAARALPEYALARR